MATIGERIHSARVGAGFSQRELADAIGVDRQAVILWEKDRHAPKGDSLIALAQACGVGIEEITQGSARLDPPITAPALKAWVGQRLASVNQGLNEYLEAIIEAEVERRVQERLTATEPTPQQRLALAEEAAAQRRAEARRARGAGGKGKGDQPNGRAYATPQRRPPLVDRLPGRLCR